ncbi:MAG: helix-turn-helix transcriptional regulator [Bacteroidales bacterium]|nr:helix-turn-helix transcriptional regulator [Lachnoclostridium sp.]MCM1384503.1 helix-turn-helix transcriptional regulator [Lachnoclostridium sp.]MCM1464047.1 helix-turn-helix transcriptional regulator [Bacteroidales bacterium]
MEKYLNRLADLVLEEIGNRNCSCVCFADLCGISRNEMSNIVNRKKNDIKLSTILKICENSQINEDDVFGVNFDVQKDIEVIVRVKGKSHRFLKDGMK